MVSAFGGRISCEISSSVHDTRTILVDTRAMRKRPALVAPARLQIGGSGTLTAGMSTQLRALTLGFDDSLSLLLQALALGVDSITGF